jgi:phosphoglycolate phosphatase
MNYQVILWDLDGTIINSKPGISGGVRYALAHFGRNDPFVEDVIGPTLMESFQKYYNMDKEQALIAIKKYREYYKERGIWECELYDGVKETLAELHRRGKPMVLATSKPQVFARQIVAHFGLERYFTYVGGSELDGSRSDKQELILHGLEQIGRGQEPRDHLLMVGDRRFDMEGAKKLGAHSVGVLYGFGSRQELTQAGATYLVQRPEEILALVD